MLNKINTETRQKVAAAVKEITGKEIEIIIPQPEKREALYIEYKILITDGKHSPTTALIKFKKTIRDLHIAKAVIKAMHQMKYEEPIQKTIKNPEERLLIYNFYVKNGLNKTIEKYFKFY